MATAWPAPHLAGLGKRADARDLVFKVKYNGTIKRFNACVNGSYLDCNLAVLRSKIASAFKFSADVEFILTYTDEDGDLVMLDDANDLRDAAIHQKLNPLRIDVQLKNSNAEALGTKKLSSSSRSLRSAALEDQLAQVKSAIDEAMKFVPEQIPAVLTKLSHDLRSKAVSSVPSLAELLERLATLITPKGNIPTSSAPVYGSSCSVSVGPQASRNARSEHENELNIGSASQPSTMQRAPGLKGVLHEDHKAQVEQAPVYTPVDLLNFTTSGGKKSNHKGNTIAESKGRYASRSKGKSTTSSAVPAFSASTSAATPIQRTPPPSMGENKLRYWPTYGSNGLFSGGSGSQFRQASSVLPPYHQHLGSSSYQYDWQPSFASLTNMYGPPKFNVPSSLGTYVPSKDGLYPTGNSYKYDVPSSVSNTEGRYSFGRSYNYRSTPQLELHKWIQCVGCGVTPIAGPRYKSNVKDDYDLCGDCFSHLGKDSEYTRLDKPASVNKPNLLGCLQQGELKLECSFIKDITIPDGTSMAPLHPFTKIWRLCNTGCTVWPFGTQIVWVGGDQFAVQNSVKLGISMYGVVGGEEVDVAVDFLAPAKPGRYTSYWTLASPSGKMFGQHIWVLIEVQGPIQTSDNRLPETNLNLPPATKSTALKPLLDTNRVPRDPSFQYPLNIYNQITPYHYDSVRLESESEPDSPTSTNFEYPSYGETSARFQKPIILKETQPASGTSSSIPAASNQVQTRTTDDHASSSGSALKSMSSPVSAPETIPLPKSVSFAVPVSAPIVAAPASLPVHTPTTIPTSALPDESINEEKLLRDLEELGFGQVDLNKEMLRRNDYDLEESVRELCSLDDWDPLFGELAEMGFDGAEMNKEAVTKPGGGTIKKLVMSLVTRAKDQ